MSEGHTSYIMEWETTQWIRTGQESQVASAVVVASCWLSLQGLSPPLLSPVSSHLDLPPPPVPASPVSPASAAEFSQQVANSANVWSQHHVPSAGYGAIKWKDMNVWPKHNSSVCHVNNCIIYLQMSCWRIALELHFIQGSRMVRHIFRSVECNPCAGVHSPPRPGSTPGLLPTSDSDSVLCEMWPGHWVLRLNLLCHRLVKKRQVMT